MAEITSSLMRCPQGYVVRPGKAEDCALLPVIERAAAEMFRGMGLLDLDGAGLGTCQPMATFETAAGEGLLWIAETTGSEAVGFALCARAGNHLHLAELSVHPSHGRKGLGRVLALTACLAARERTLLPVTLATFRDVPWNGPFYKRLGFKEIPREAYLPWMHENERVAARAMDIRKRCFMRWDGP